MEECACLSVWAWKPFLPEVGGFCQPRERGINDRLDTTWGHGECHVFLDVLVLTCNTGWLALRFCGGMLILVSTMMMMMVLLIPFSISPLLISRVRSLFSPLSRCYMRFILCW